MQDQPIVGREYDIDITELPPSLRWPGRVKVSCVGLLSDGELAIWVCGQRSEEHLSLKRWHALNPRLVPEAPKWEEGPNRHFLMGESGDEFMIFKRDGSICVKTNSTLGGRFTPAELAAIAERLGEKGASESDG